MMQREMRMPGFTAETSLEATQGRYATASVGVQSLKNEGGVQPQSIFDIILNPCNYCFQNCARNLRGLSSGRDCLDACRFAGLC